MLFYTLSGYFSQYLRDYFWYCHLGISCITMGIQNNSSHIVLCRKSIHLGAFLVPVPIDKAALRDFYLFHAHLCLSCEELEILRSGNKDTLAFGLCNNPPQQNRAVFLCLFYSCPMIFPPPQVIFGLLLLSTAAVLAFDIRYNPFGNGEDGL